MPKPRANCKSLRPLIELYGRDRDRMREEVEITERQLKHRLALFAKPDDAAIRKVVCKNARRALAVYLHVRSGHRGRPETKCSVAIILISE